MLKIGNKVLIEGKASSEIYDIISITDDICLCMRQIDKTTHSYKINQLTKVYLPKFKLKLVKTKSQIDNNKIKILVNHINALKTEFKDLYKKTSCLSIESKNLLLEEIKRNYNCHILKYRQEIKKELDKTTINFVKASYKGLSKDIIYKNHAELASAFKKMKQRSIELVKNQRYLDKQSLYSEKITSTGHRYTLVKGIHSVPGKFIELQTLIDNISIDIQKIPQTKDNYVGIEIEFITPFNADIIKQKLKQHKLSKYCNLKGDPSIKSQDGEIGRELNILCKETDYKNIISRVSYVLETELEAYTNSSCGLHIHLDMRNKNHLESFDRLYRSEEILYQFVNKHRRKNSTCMRSKSTFALNANEERHYGINTVSYHKYKTLEVRIHSGTINAEKINNWIETLLTIVSTPISKKLETFDEFINIVPLNENLQKYLKNRKDTYNV